MTVYRKAKPEEREACIEFANYVFSTSYQPHDFETLLPKMYGSGQDIAPYHRVAADEDGRIRAMVAVLPEKLYMGGKMLRAGYVGTVSVHPKVRSEGHMKALMGAWIEELSKTCDLAVLGGQRQRYEYFGFTPGGLEYCWSVNQSNIRHRLAAEPIEDYSFCPFFREPEAAAFAARLNQKRSCYVERSEDRMEAILSSFGEEPLAVKKKGRLTGYLLTCQPNGIAELALEHPEDLRAVLPAYMKFRKLTELSLHTPLSECATNDILKTFAEDFHIERGGMYQIFDFANVLEACLTLKQNTIGITPGIFSAVLAGQPVTVHAEKDSISVERTAPADALQLNRQQAQELLLSLSGCFGQFPEGITEAQKSRIPAGWFPLPLHWYMADEF